MVHSALPTVASLCSPRRRLESVMRSTALEIASLALLANDNMSLLAMLSILVPIARTSVQPAP